MIVNNYEYIVRPQESRVPSPAGFFKVRLLRSKQPCMDIINTKTIERYEYPSASPFPKSSSGDANIQTT
ncbi:hypothetical protein VMCG_04757 [Cytospora schulzeri]|uniref:Uncharacterized protein n=1 Tax=Cytospora schulzeri TaxID=448051 RepID=A0A423WMM6_9PEZI|nr:hypothetical protein VMCG_04757 [Valsa malicola]